MTTCFYLEPTDRCIYGLRCYCGSDIAKCDGKYGYHNAHVALGQTPAIFEGEGWQKSVRISLGLDDFINDDRWPMKCDYCDYVFKDEDHRQVAYDLLYRRTDTGEELTTRNAPPGAMWDAWWMPPRWKGPDGRSLMVVCPDGREWAIDGPAKNCTLPGDQDHRCWLRVGEPPKVTVSKNGPPGWRTCSAGAGSIDTGGYHGFLTDGVFV